jgi:anti-sigma28 factor (negative regulator of flagellin synthesis)
MVSSQKRNQNVSVSTKYFRTEALNEWIRNIKSKKSFKKRQSKGADLRTIAILNLSLLQNQKVLRQKQRERSERWMELKAMIENGSYNEKSDSSDSCDLERLKADEEEKKNEIKALWKEELNDIDNFMNNLNSIKTSLVR